MKRITILLFFAMATAAAVFEPIVGIIRDGVFEVFGQ